jgi:hypothetical protein
MRRFRHDVARVFTVLGSVVAKSTTLASGSKLAMLVNRRYCVLERQRGELFAPGIEEYIGADDQRPGSQLEQGRKGGVDVVFGAETLKA